MLEKVNVYNEVKTFCASGKRPKSFGEFFGQQHNKSVGHRVAVHASSSRTSAGNLCAFEILLYSEEKCLVQGMFKDPLSDLAFIW